MTSKKTLLAQARAMIDEARKLEADAGRLRESAKLQRKAADALTKTRQKAPAPPPIIKNAPRHMRPSLRQNAPRPVRSATTRALLHFLAEQPRNRPFTAAQAAAWIARSSWSAAARKGCVTPLEYRMNTALSNCVLRGVPGVSAYALAHVDAPPAQGAKRLFKKVAAR